MENSHVEALKDWRRVRKIYRRNKHLKEVAGSRLKCMFPDAVWVSAIYLHRHNLRYALFLHCISLPMPAGRDSSF